ncbi:MAG: exopolysaccharide biosynthesis polyprenyl glycosylphosphotransferase [Candidatus Cloacimonadota bacterium]|nr:exopolysaccharide biosynthesis polyprenyl glycosylphosphotransferase [Candidatus Cloacimonadota bacterium]
MSYDQNTRNEFLKDYTDKNLKKKKNKYYKKVILWQFVVKFSYFLKRVIDLVLSIIFLIILSPIMVLTSLAIVIEDPGPILFFQTRIGKDGKPFDFYKFRSMVVDADKKKKDLLSKNESKNGIIFKMKRDPRVTKVGRFIRHFSIDELPQLINVLKGDMSLVGPRPPLPSEVNSYSLEDRKRLHIKPGITCIWQVSGRSDIPFNKQVELDKQYISSHSFWKDLLILLKTIPAVITGKGAY